MRIGSVTLILETPERAVDVNRGLLRDGEIARHCTVVYINATTIRLDTHWPRVCIDWLVGQEVINPATDNYVLEDSANGN